MFLKLIVFVFLCALIHALLEIQIEGENGWAEKLPTKRFNNPFEKITGWTYIDGYHLFTWILFILFFHLPFLFNLSFNFQNELLILESIFVFFLVEDFLWFVINPKWGIKNFFTQKISWHPNKILFFPQNYWISFIIIFVLDFIRKSV